MGREIEEEYKQFLSDISDSAFVFGRYMDEDEYIDDYSMDEIEIASDKLLGRIMAYLHEHRPGEFVVTSGWCIFVMTPERARQTRLTENDIQLSIVR